MNRIAILLNFISLIALVVFFELLTVYDWNPELLIYEIIPTLVFLITFFKFYIKSGMYRKMSWICKDKDMVLKTYYHSYSIYTIFITLTLMLHYFTKVGLNMILISSLLYLAFIIPAYLVNWNRLNLPEHEK